MRFEHGPIAFEVEHRAPGPEGGPTLRVRRSSDSRELLRFDAFVVKPHRHIDPDGPDEIAPIPGAGEPIDQVLHQLRSDLDGLLAKAGFAGPAVPAGDEREALLDRVEAALRNPPAKLRDLPLDEQRQRTGEKWQVYGDDVLPLWVADMDFPVAEPIRRQLERAIRVGDLGYPMYPKPTPIPQLFVERKARLHGWEIDPRRVDLLTDVVQGMYVAILALTEPGDGLVVQSPIYPPFFGAVEKTGRRLVENPLLPGEGGWSMNLDELRRLAPSARMVMLCNPHNPTGRAFRRDELEAVAEIAREHDLWILSDEIHSELVHTPNEHVPIASLDADTARRTLTLDAASKAFNIAGLRTAVAVYGSAEMQKRCDAGPRHIRGGIGTLGIQATIAAWQHSDPWLVEVQAQLLENRTFATGFVRQELPDVRFWLPEATYFLWMDCTALELEPSPYRFFLHEAKIGLSDGPAFGAPGKGFVRLNFATSPEILEQALVAMARAVRGRG